MCRETSYNNDTLLRISLKCVITADSEHLQQLTLKPLNSVTQHKICSENQDLSQRLAAAARWGDVQQVDSLNCSRPRFECHLVSAASLKTA